MQTISHYNFPSKIPHSLFRAYDIRGVANQEELSPDLVYHIGLAIGSEVRAQEQTKVLIARDGRLSSPHLSKALCDGLVATGCEVIDLGTLPTSVLYFATNWYQVPAGVMLTGSHNPIHHNGLKIVLNGQTIAEEDIQNLYQRIISKNFHLETGTYRQEDVSEAYIKRITQDVKLSKPLKIVVDAGNGVAGPIALSVFKEMGCDIIPLFCEIDGNFPHHHPDPSDEKNMEALRQAVKEYKADVGLAFDGDGDRLGVMTSEGEIIWPDRLMMLLVQSVLTRSPGCTILFDIKCTQHLPKIIEAAGGKPLQWKTGHSLIKAKMLETGALLAGEMSGHIFFKERWYGFDDGIYAGARLLEILSEESRTLDAIFKTFPTAISTTELKISIPDEVKHNFIQTFIQNANFPKAKINLLDGLRADFPFGWGLVRPSNTTPCLVVRFEADNIEELKRIQSLFREQLLAIDSTLEIPF